MTNDVWCIDATQRYPKRTKIEMDPDPMTLPPLFSTTIALSTPPKTLNTIEFCTLPLAQVEQVFYYLNFKDFVQYVSAVFMHYAPNNSPSVGVL